MSLPASHLLGRNWHVMSAFVRYGPAVYFYSTSCELILKWYPAQTKYSGDKAATYDSQRSASWLSRWRRRRELDLLRAVLPPATPGAKILDAPVGTGRFIPTLRELGYEVTGVDISLDMLEQARASHSADGVRLVQADCAALIGFKDNEFDYVVSLRFMGHLPPPVRLQVLKEFGRVASKGIVVGFPTLNVATFVRRFVGNLRYRLRVGGHRTWWPAWYRSALVELEQAGLHVTQRKPLFWGLNQTYYLHLFSKRS